MITEIGDMGFIASALGTVMFSLTYSVIAPWWRTVAGRIIWTFATTVSLIMILATMRFIWGPMSWLYYVRPVAYFALASSIWGAVIALIRVQLFRNRAKKNKP